MEPHPQARAQRPRPDGILEARFLADGGASDVAAPDGRAGQRAAHARLVAVGVWHDLRGAHAQQTVAQLGAFMKPPPRSALDDALLSPMPGTLVSLKVAEGDQVVEGQELCVIEAMKMQNVLTATRDGIVQSLYAQAGATLSADQPIITFVQEGEA